MMEVMGEMGRVATGQIILLVVEVEQDFAAKMQYNQYKDQELNHIMVEETVVLVKI
tara:strand:- start:169 stop:336 length:168 start_codon:yes stop_codon:yes gene_type:complete